MGVSKKLAYSVTVYDENSEAHVFGPDSKEIPGWARKAITNPSAWSDGGDDESPSDPAAPGGEAADYSAMNKAELENAVNARNEGRSDDSKIVVEGNGNKPDLIKALKADDEKTAGA